MSGLFGYPHEGKELRSDVLNRCFCVPSVVMGRLITLQHIDRFVNHDGALFHV